MTRRRSRDGSDSPLPGSSLPGKLQAAIELNSLFTPDDLVVVAISGGPDSTALLYALNALGYSVHAANLNHGLREEAALDADYVHYLCSKLGISYTLGRADTLAEKARGGSIQEAARRLRYRFLDRVADEVGAAAIATAHTQGDQVETVLLNIIRGTGPQGLAGIPIRRGRIVRPMLDVSRAEVEAYCAANALTPRHDMSNDSTKYARNRIRHTLLPSLRERFNASVDEAILRLSEIAAAESTYIDDQARKWLDGMRQIPLAELKMLPIALQRRVLHVWLTETCGAGEVGFDQIERLRNGSRAITLPGNIIVALDDGCLARRPETLIPAEWSERAMPVAVPSECCFCGWNVALGGDIPASVSPILRLNKRGDKMRIAYGHKRLSDLFREEKVPSDERWRMPVLADINSGEVLAAAGVRRVSVLTPALTFTAERITAG